MIVWVASFPRSGNTFLRIVLHRLYGLRTSVVYDVDGVAARVGVDLVGFEERPASIDAMRADGDPHLVKTHNPRDERIDDADRAICLVRDGRDALVSWARQRTEGDAPVFEAELRTRIDPPEEVGAGTWGPNVLSWLTPPAPHRRLLRYEELVGDPTRAVTRTVAALLPELTPSADARLPTFAELRLVDDRFFRRGHTGTHLDEMPDDLHQLFWSRPDNAAAMRLLGYGPPPST